MFPCTGFDEGAEYGRFCKLIAKGSNLPHSNIVQEVLSVVEFVQRSRGSIDSQHRGLAVDGFLLHLFLHRPRSYPVLRIVFHQCQVELEESIPDLVGVEVDAIAIGLLQHLKDVAVLWVLEVFLGVFTDMHFEWKKSFVELLHQLVRHRWQCLIIHDFVVVQIDNDALHIGGQLLLSRTQFRRSWVAHR